MLMVGKKKEPSDGQIEAALIAAARVDFPIFVELVHPVAFGEVFDAQPWHAELFAVLMRVFNGQCPRLIVNIAPRAGKTVLMLLFEAWARGKAADANTIIVSYGADLAERSSVLLMRIIETPIYARIFPGTRISRDSSARDRWATTQGGEVRAVGVGGALTGFGAGRLRDSWGGLILIDDPLKAAEARSDVAREGVKAFYLDTLRSRRNSPRTSVVLICQRLHEADLAGELLSGVTGESWELLKISALNERDESFWERRFPAAELVALRQAQPWVYFTQYAQEPAPVGGGMIKPGNIQIVDHVPAVADAIRGWDLASVEGGGDYTVGAKVGRLADGRWCIANVVRGQWGPDERDEVMGQTTVLDGDGVTQSIPEDPGQSGKSLKLYLSRKLASLPGGPFTIHDSREDRDKIHRAEPFAAQVNAGNFCMLRGPWNDALVQELGMFPSGRHDDQVDACSRAFSLLVQRGSNDALLELMALDRERALANSQAQQRVQGPSGKTVVHGPVCDTEIMPDGSRRDIFHGDFW